MAAFCHMATTSYNKHLHMTLVLRRIKQVGAKLANQPGKGCRARCDVPLDGAFNALCQPAELGMIALFAI